MNITEAQWRNACIFSHKCSLSTKMQEKAYKLFARWYLTTAKLNKWNPQIPDTCWRCGGDVGTLLHVWWSCPLLTTYWDEVREIIVLMTEKNIRFNAACCLLHISKFTLKCYKNSLTKHLLNAAKTLIPTLWRATRTPIVGEWLDKVSEICVLEDTLVQSYDRVEKFHKTWSPWFLFRYCRSFEDMKATKLST